MTLTEYLNQTEPKKLPSSSVAIEKHECQIYYLLPNYKGVHVPKLHEMYGHDDYNVNDVYDKPCLKTEDGRHSVFYLNFNPFKN